MSNAAPPVAHPGLATPGEPRPMDSYMSVDAMVQTPDASVRPPPRKRTKKAQSCDPCRRRKLKCDRGLPCGACRDRSEQHLCTWEDGVVPENAGRDAQDSVLVLQKVSAMESHLDRILQRMEHIEARVCDPSSAKASEHKEASASSPIRGHWSDVSEYDANTVGGLFGMTWQPASADIMRRTLRHMHSFMPSKLIMPLLIDVYEREIDWMNEILRKDEVCERMDLVVSLSACLNEDADYLSRMSRAELMRLIYAEALLFSIFGLSLVFTRDLSFNKLYLEHGSMPVHGRFFHEAQLGLSTLNVFEEPHIDYIICSLLLLTGICSIRAPAVGVGLLHQAVQVALLLDLDVEPPVTMPKEEATRRVQIYALLSIHDWFCTTTTKRYPAIHVDPVRLPSVFGTQEQRSKYLSEYQQYKLDIAHLYSQSSALILPHHDDYEHVCRLHDDVLRLKARMPDSWRADAQVHPTASESTRNIHITLGSAALHFLLLRIHLHYYVRGWDDTRFRLSRDTCFTSARSLMRTFREAFSWKIPPKCADAQERSADFQVPDEVSVAARMWWFCNWSTAAALLLLQHLTMLNERNEIPSWDQERESILQDLCIMSRLLQYLSPVTSVARDGYEAMQRVAAHVLKTTFDAPRNANDNCVTHWAARIVQARTRSTGKEDVSGSAEEPMSLLNKMMKNEGIAERRSEERAASDESPSSKVRVDSLHSTPSFSAQSSSGEPPEMPPVYMNASQPLGNVQNLPNGELDTFWAKFALPSLAPSEPGVPSPMSVAPPNPMYPNVPPAMPPAMEWYTDPRVLDSTLAVQQKDRLAPSQFNFPMGSLGPLTDDFIKSFENYSSRFAPDGVGSLSM